MSMSIFCNEKKNKCYICNCQPKNNNSYANRGEMMKNISPKFLLDLPMAVTYITLVFVFSCAT